MENQYEFVVTHFDCDDNLKQYDETLLCDGDDAICIMTAEDEYHNEVGLDLRVRGEVRIGWRDDINDDFEFYQHYSQFPEELTEVIKKGDYYDNEHVCVDMNNWLETVYYLNGDSIDSFMFEEDIAKMTVEDMKTYLMECTKNIFVNAYECGDFKKEKSSAVKEIERY